LLVLPATGRTVDFHHTITRALPGAPKNPQKVISPSGGHFCERIFLSCVS